MIISYEVTVLKEELYKTIAAFTLSRPKVSVLVRARTSRVSTVTSQIPNFPKKFKNRFLYTMSRKSFKASVVVIIK